MAVPSVLEQVLRVEAVFCIEDQNFGLGFAALEIGCDERSALVGGGRAAKRIRRSNEHEQSAVLHAFQLLAQQPGLLACIPGVRHDLHRRFVIALKRPIPECDAWRNNETVVAEL